MAILARKVALPEAWASAEDAVHWNGSDFPPFVMDELKDGFEYKHKGLSFYDVTINRKMNLRRIASFLFLKGTNHDEIRPAQYRFVNTNDLERHGINYVQTPGNLSVPDLDALHYDISHLSGQKAIKLVSLLTRKSKVEVISGKQIAQQMLKEIRNFGKLPDKNWPSKGLLQGLHKQGMLGQLAKLLKDLG